MITYTVLCRIVFFKCSVEGFVQLRNISLSYTYIVIVKHGHDFVLFFLGWVR